MGKDGESRRLHVDECAEVVDSGRKMFLLMP